MTDKFKKIDRRYILSDSSVNEYGFRLLTSGYELEAFQKNPIGYYMHRREDGIALKWEDLCIEEDKILATPVINLSNTRGEQICNEAENGFLNAASVGHIVVLEYSTDPEMMLPGQTGPTVTKWYNKECSLVDIPGNTNALTKLYDAQENEINLADFGSTKPVFKTVPANVLSSIATLLHLDNMQEEQPVVGAIQDLIAKVSNLEFDCISLTNEKNVLMQQLKETDDLRREKEINLLLDRGLEDRKITAELRMHLAKDYAQNADGLKTLLSAMPAYRSIVESLKNNKPDINEAEWQWDDYEKNDETGRKLKDLRANDPIRYKELFDKKFSLDKY